MLSKSSKYALRAVLCLAIHTDETSKMSPGTIADRIDVPHAYLATILKSLSKKGLISSTKGRNGGFFLTAENKAAPLINIIENMEGLTDIDACIMGLHTCSNETPCPMHYLYQPFKVKLLKDLQQKSIEDFALAVEKGETTIL
ncbi:transcriptional regulator [Putridiphycobacter roseus]|uniref:Transcriptional regulator n=1 Tax=Putridiphycobacter roseus TaxID=2219161 RepID=A0A2W1N3F0_9FLAO|nr:Rrf2 family transcriptional regulator [Putridiphycobacter roseus]PZE18090.1 transcriptional regulator [Putridiphycobacter roseus]